MGRPPLIQLTTSAARRVRASRARWGWRPGLPVVVHRVDDGFEFRTPDDTTGPRIDFASRGVALAVTEPDAAYFRGSVLSSGYEALFGRELWWLENPNDPGRSGCSDPLGASCSPDKFRRLHPELFGVRGLVARWRGGLAADDREQVVARTSAFLRWGDGRAAVVVQLAPLVVAAYCDEMDAAVLLRFPRHLARGYGLDVGSRLVTANLHHRGDGGVAADLTPGPNYFRRFTNVRPLVADFLAAEDEVVEARRRTIAEAEYERCREFGERALRAGQPVRSGRPLEAGRPAG